MIGWNVWTADDLVQLMDLIRGGHLAPAIDRVLTLEETAEGERMLEDREVFGKILIKP